MPDIQLRFHHDMLVLSSPIAAALERQGFEIEGDIELLLMTEPEEAADAVRMQSVAGAQCLVTPTQGITEARLARQRMEGHAQEVADAAVGMLRQYKPQHLIAEIGATGLPIDPGSKPSLLANRDQYSAAVALFAGKDVDAIFFSDLASADDLRCELMGGRRVCDLPLFASVRADAEGRVLGRSMTVEECAAIAQEYEASVFGIHMDADPDDVVAVTKRLAGACDIPILVQVDAFPKVSRLPRHEPESAYSMPDDMVQLAARLRAAGAQFLRASGKATPSYTGALAATVMGVDCIR